MHINQQVVSVLCLIACFQQAIGRDLPSEIKYPEIAEHYREQNLCPYLGVDGANLDYNLWCCTIPQKINYCGLSTKFVYDCCPGFVRSPLANNQCGEVQSAWKQLPDFLSTYGYASFASILTTPKELKSLSSLNSTGVYTVFVPYKASTLTSGEVNFASFSGSGSHPILGHVALSRTYSIDFKDRTVLPSMYPNQNIKITVYSNNLVFAECQALIKPDLEARNGVAHIISGPILPYATQRKTIMQALRNHPEASAFSADIPSDIQAILSKEDSPNWFTVLVPRNSAWQGIKSRYSSQDVRTLVLNHILQRMICSQAITEVSTKLGPTMADEYIGVDCSQDGKRYFLDVCQNRVSITQADIMTGNGVIHVIDKPLPPTAVMSLEDALVCHGKNPDYDVSTTLSQWRACSISLNSAGKYIVLAPLQEAHEWFRSYSGFSSEFSRFTSDSSYRCNTYKYHVLQLQGEYTNLEDSWWNQVGFKTLYTFDGAFSVNYYVKYRYGTELYFENSRVKNLKALRFKLGYIYYLDRVNVIPERLRVDILKGRTDLSLVSEKVSSSGFAPTLKAQGPFSLFLAPRNRGWTSRAENKYTGEILQNYLKLHTVKLRYWGDDIGYFERETYQNVESLLIDADGKPFQLRFKRMLNGNMYIGYETLPEDEWALVLEWNLYGTDGIIWVIDWPMRCPPAMCDKFKLPEKDYFAVYATACTTMEGVATSAQYDQDPLAIARKNSDKCVVFKLPPKVAYREWEVASTG